MSIGEMIICGLIAINIGWSQLLCSKLNRVLNILFQIKYRKEIPGKHKDDEWMKK